MKKEEKKKYLKSLYKKRGIEIDFIDDIEFSVIEKYASQSMSRKKIIDKIAQNSVYIDGKHYADKYKKMTIPVIEYNELCELLKDILIDLETGTLDKYAAYDLIITLLSKEKPTDKEIRNWCDKYANLTGKGEYGLVYRACYDAIEAIQDNPKQFKEL